MGSPVVHFEVNGSDAEATANFYSELFGWNTQSAPDMNYVLVDTAAGGGINGGFGKVDDAPPHVTFYMEVEDLQATLEKIESLGGKTVVAPTKLPIVTFALFADPQDNLLGLVKATEEQAPGVSPGSNPAVGWFEILGSDGETLQSFYSEVFGWKTKKVGPGEVVYYEVDPASEKGIPGGIGTGRDGKQVTVYVGVGDLNAYLDKASGLGGKTVMEPLQVDENTHVAAFADPEGRVFGLFSSSAGG